MAISRIIGSFSRFNFILIHRKKTENKIQLKRQIYSESQQKTPLSTRKEGFAILQKS